MFERFTEKAIKVVMLSQEESRRLGHNFVGTEQILLGLIGENGGVAYKVLRSLGVTLREARTEVERIIGRGSGFVAVEIPFTPRAKRVLEIAIEEARDLGHGYIGTEHILLALLEEEIGVGVRVLQQLGLEINQIRTEVLIQIGEAMDLELGANRDELGDIATVSIEEFTSNLTEAAFNGKLDPVIGRDEEIERVIQILVRRRKNNPVLIGEPGVGKTAVAEGLAQRIIKREVPDILEERQVISLDIGLLLAGTKYRGEFEERVKRIMDEVRTTENIILVIDEVHTLIGAGAAEGAVDAANILKPALARGELQCIGATTIEEYRKHIERDAALERRFQPVHIDEPSIQETIEILRCLRSSYERHHGLTITDTALEAAARMGAQYIADRFMPDKAIDLMDEAGSRVRLKAIRVPDSASEIESELREVLREKEKSIAEQNFEVAGAMLDRELELRAQLSAIVSTMDRVPDNYGTAKSLSTVTEDDIASVVAAWTGIPVSKISKSESEQLLQMEETLHNRIIGQDAAVSAVSRAIRRARVGLRNPNRPIASFLFSGPTGVGKTELTKALALYFFGSEKSLVRLDMSEYMERHTIAKLIGSPPGYIGYSEGGQLTEAIRRKPYTVVLFDEVEKAHPDVFNLLLQILEDGRLTDSKGRTIDFKNSMLILTSNIGAKQVEKAASSVGGDIGFSNAFLLEGDVAYSRMSTLVNEELKKFFRPEFLNRLDDIIVFRQLTKRDLGKIADLMLKQLTERTEGKNFILKITQRAKNVLVDEGFDPSYGARPLRRVITKLLEDKLATTVLADNIAPGSMIMVDANDRKELTLNVSHAPTEKENNVVKVDTNKTLETPVVA